MPRNRKQKGHLELAREIALKVLTESAVVIVILGCTWAIHVAAEGFFGNKQSCRASTETSFYYVQGESGTPATLIKTIIVEHGCESSR